MAGKSTNTHAGCSVVVETVPSFVPVIAAPILSFATISILDESESFANPWTEAVKGSRNSFFRGEVYTRKELNPVARVGPLCL
jgi:hypothetical protein